MSLTTTDQYTPSLHNTQYPTPNMLAAALWWAGKGWAIGTGHEPLFDHPQGYRCTCEAYRHSDLCKTRDEERKSKGKQPLYLADGEHCDAPGKHPRGLEHGLKDFTTDPDKIRAMWRKHPNANILGLPGSAGYVTLDGDTYKPEYAGNGLTADELNTPINLSGNGGEHLIYRKHPGATYSNRTGNLPDGIDVRGDDGYIVLPPSLHYSGNRYQMKPGYEFSKIEPQLLPQRIHDALTAATEKATRHAVAVVNLAPAGERPDLAQWALSDTTLDRIHTPATRGHRSEHDYNVVLALKSAGATADDIHAVFAHYPVGLQGKYAEAGPAYLARTIANANAWLDEHPPQTAGNTQLVDRCTVLLDFSRSADFAEHVPVIFHSVTGYRTAGTDKALAMQLLRTAYSQGKLDRFTVSFHDLAVGAGVAVGGIRKILERLEHWFVEIERPETGRWVYSIASPLLTMADEAKKLPTLNKEKQPLCELLFKVGNFFDAPLPSMAGHDLYSRSLSAITPQELAERNADRAAHDLPPMAMTRTLRNRLAAAVGSVGKNALRIADLLAVSGPTLEYSELCERLQMKKHSVSRLTSRLSALGIVEKDTHTVTLLDDWREMSDAMAIVCANAGADRKRRLNRCDNIMRCCDKAMATATDERKVKLQRFRERIRNEKEKLIAQEIPLDAAAPVVVAVGKWRKDSETFCDFLAKRKRDVRIRVASQPSAHARPWAHTRWDRVEMNRTATDAADALRQLADLPPHEQRAKMQILGYSANEVLAGERLNRAGVA